jgi:hypothetical protein
LNISHFLLTQYILKNHNYFLSFSLKVYKSVYKKVKRNIIFSKMSSLNSFEENQRLSQRACHLLTGYLPSATKITFDDSDEEKAVKIVPKAIQNHIQMKPPHVIDVAKLMKEIFGSDGNDEEEEEVDYYQQSKGLLEYYATHCTQAMAIEAIRKNQQHRCGEDYGAGVPCYNTDCYRDYTNDYFQRVFVEEGVYQRLCPDCIIPDEEEDHDDQEKHKDKRVKICT